MKYQCDLLVLLPILVLHLQYWRFGMLGGSRCRRSARIPPFLHGPRHLAVGAVMSGHSQHLSHLEKGDVQYTAIRAETKPIIMTGRPISARRRRPTRSTMDITMSCICQLISGSTLNMRHTTKRALIPKEQDPQPRHWRIQRDQKCAGIVKQSVKAGTPVDMGHVSTPSLSFPRMTYSSTSALSPQHS